MPKPAGAEIRKVRVAHGDKVSDLAKVAKIKRNSLINIECCIKPASIEVLTRIANHYKADVNDFIDASSQAADVDRDSQATG